VERKALRKGMVASLLVFVLGLGAFLRIAGSENVRAVQMVALLVSGVGLGMGVAYVRVLVGMGSQK